jgi:hypothetical protein
VSKEGAIDTVRFLGKLILAGTREVGMALHTVAFIDEKGAPGGSPLGAGKGPRRAGIDNGYFDVCANLSQAVSYGGIR